MIDHALISFYRLWHGKLHLRGAGNLVTRIAKIHRGLQDYALSLPNGNIIQVDFRDVSAMYWLNHLLGDLFEEQGLLCAMKRFLKKDSILWDIGSNSGLLSYHLSQLPEIGELHLFEPNPKMIKLAKQALSTWHHARIHPFGLSDRNSIFTLTIPHGHSTMGTLEAQSTERTGRECQVTCRKGDDLVFNEGFRPPQLIKIDTEGHELAVLAGLKRTIAMHKPIIFFEHISLDLGQVMALMPPDYKLHTISDQDGELVDPMQGGGHNSVLIPGSL
jgi:FkbM family methyltransferase